MEELASSSYTSFSDLITDECFSSGNSAPVHMVSCEQPKTLVSRLLYPSTNTVDNTPSCNLQQNTTSARRNSSCSRIKAWLESEPNTPELSPNDSPIWSPLTSPQTDTKNSPTMDEPVLMLPQAVVSLPPIARSRSGRRPVLWRPHSEVYGAKRATSPTRSQNGSVSGVASSTVSISGFKLPLKRTWSLSEPVDVKQPKPQHPLEDLFGPFVVPPSLKQPTCMPKLARTASTKSEASIESHCRDANGHVFVPRSTSLSSINAQELEARLKFLATSCQPSRPNSPTDSDSI